LADEADSKSDYDKFFIVFAQMAELVDAADSKSAVRKDVQVRFLFWAQATLLGWLFYFCKNSALCISFMY
jgi:hypothetical protein